MRILKDSHISNLSIYLGGNKIYQDIMMMYQYPSMKKDVGIVGMYVICQRVKAKYQCPSSLYQPLRIPEQKWDDILIDFFDRLPWSNRGYESIWVIMDHLMNFSHFIPVSSKRVIEYLARKYVQQVMKYHGSPHMSIIQRYCFCFCVLESLIERVRG